MANYYLTCKDCTKNKKCEDKIRMSGIACNGINTNIKHCGSCPMANVIEGNYDLFNCSKHKIVVYEYSKACKIGERIIHNLIPYEA